VLPAPELRLQSARRCLDLAAVGSRLRQLSPRPSRACPVPSRVGNQRAIIAILTASPESTMLMLLHYRLRIHALSTRARIEAAALRRRKQWVGSAALAGRLGGAPTQSRKGRPTVRDTPHPTVFAASPLLALAAVSIALAIFVIDTFTILDIAIAVLYAVVVLVASSFLGRRGVIVVASTCAALTVLGYLLSHGLSVGTPLVRCVISLFAIGIATLLALRNQAAVMAIRGQAQLLDLTHDAIFVLDMNDVIAYWNRGAEELYGWKADKALNKVSHELLRTSFSEPREEIERKLLGTGRWEGELLHTKSDATQVVVSSRWSLQRNGRGQPVAILETNTDHTERKRAEDALRRSEAYLAEGQRLSLTGSFGWKPSTGEIFWSAQTYQIFGYDQGIEPTIELARHRVHPEDLPRAHQAFERAAWERRDIDLEHRLLMPDGSIKHMRVLAHATTDLSNRVEFIGAVMDVTAAKQAQGALQQAQSELAHVTRVTTLGELAASIAHEVNQPLAGIVTNGEAGLRWLAREQPRIEEARRSLERVISDADRASAVIRGIRDLAKRAAPDMVSLDINEPIEAAMALVQSKALRQQVTLQLELARGLPMVRGDRVQLQQVIINLVMNGIEAMLGTSDWARRLVIGSQPYEGDQVLVSVQDSGPGIDPETGNRLFSAFYTTKPDGMGMGLSICRSIVEGHGGRIWAANNDPGPGAIIRFTLPTCPGRLSDRVPGQP
jgi:PAS domain S-box-containing protein